MTVSTETPSRQASRVSFSRGKRWVNVANVVALILLSFYILTVSNLIVYRHPYRIDLTAEKLHTLSDETKKRLDLVEDEILVVIPQLFRHDARIHRQVFQRARALLNQYIAYQPKIRVEAELNLQRQDDSLRWEEIRKKYHLTQSQLNNCVFVDSADETLWQVVSLKDLATFDHQKILSFDGERAFTEAFTRLRLRDRQKVYFLRDSGEPSIKDAGRGGISRLKEELEANGYTVQELSLLQLKAVPVDCNLLVIVNSTDGLEKAEQRKLHDYLLGGGRLWVSFGGETQGIERLLSEWGVKASSGQAYQKIQFGGGMRAQWTNHVYSRTPTKGHPITDPFSPTAFQVIGSRVRPLDVSLKDDLYVASMMTTKDLSGEIWVDENSNGRIDDGERRKTLSWGVTVQRKRPDRPPPDYVHLPTRIAVFGDGLPWTNLWFDQSSHRDLALNTVRWLVGNEREIGTSGDEWVERRLKWSPKIESFLFWVAIFLFPGVVLSFGTFIYFLRRS